MTAQRFRPRSRTAKLAAATLLFAIPAQAQAQAWRSADRIIATAPSASTGLTPHVGIEWHPPWTDPTHVMCATPTAAECMSNENDPADPNRGFWGSICGLTERDKWASGTGACAAHVQAANPADAIDYAAGTTHTVYLPPSARRGGADLAESKSLPYTHRNHYAFGMYGSYGGLLQHGAAARAAGAAVLALPGRQTWDDNGNAVNSCEEYVYEKYYDYSVFEDSVLASAGDARQVFDLAYTDDNIGARALGGDMPASKSRGTDHWADFTAYAPKNSYWKFRFDYPAGHENDKYPMNTELLGRFAIDGITNDRPHGFGWHWDRAQELSAVPDDLLYAMEEKQAEFEKLLERRARILGVWGQAQQEFIKTFSDCNAISEQEVIPDFDKYINPNPIRDIYTGINVSIVAPIMTAPIAAGMQMHAMMHFNHDGLTAAEGLNPGIDYILNESCEDLPPLQATCQSYGYGVVTDYAERVTACLKRVDQEIETELLRARDEYGCLDPFQTTVCDWSPRMFVREMSGKSLSGRNKAYAECEKWTAGNFGPTGVVRTAQTNGLAVPYEDMTGSTELIDQFTTAFRLWAGQMKFPVDPETKKPVLGGRASDNGGMGNDMFGVSYGYDVGWKLENIDNKDLRLCAAEVDLKAKFHANATVLGMNKPMVNADNFFVAENVGAAKDISYKVYLNIMGGDVLNLPPATVHIPMDGQARPFATANHKITKRFTLVEVRKTFPVGPIPVTLAAGAGGEVGLDLKIEGRMGYHCPDPNVDPNLTRNDDVLYISADGSARPFAGIQAFASAAVDIIIASAGVRADLTLLELSVPFTLRVAANVKGEGTLTLSAGSTLDIVVEALSGRVSVFINTLFGKILDETIFKWSGLRVAENLVNESWDLNLFMVRRALTL